MKIDSPCIAIDPKLNHSLAELVKVDLKLNNGLWMSDFIDYHIHWMSKEIEGYKISSDRRVIFRLKAACFPEPEIPRTIEDLTERVKLFCDRLELLQWRLDKMYDKGNLYGFVYLNLRPPEMSVITLDTPITLLQLGMLSKISKDFIEKVNREYQDYLEWLKEQDESLEAQIPS